VPNGLLEPQLTVPSCHNCTGTPRRPVFSINPNGDLESLLGLFRLNASRISGKHDDVWGTLRELATSISGALRSATGQQAAPVMLKPMLQLQGGRLVLVRYREEGALIPCQSGFEVRVQIGTPPTRLRATVAHELGHTLFYDGARRPPVRVLARSEEYRMREEVLCWDFARELLLPRGLFESEAKTIPSPEEVIRLGRKFCVSTHLVCRRAFYDTRIWENAGVSLLGAGTSEDALNRIYLGTAIRKILGRKATSLIRRLGLSLHKTSCSAERSPAFAARPWQTELGGTPFVVQATQIGASKAWTLAVFAPA
jgi:hypothetical protein